MKVFALMAWQRIAIHMLMVVLFSLALGSTPSFSQTRPKEIVELARALKNDPDLIFEYVYNNIETLPQYGSAKGALGALLDGKGTAFDQAELMVTLLQQAGYSAAYQLGQIQITASQYSSWTGADNSVNSVSIMLGSGGFPGSVSGNPVTSVRLGWAWVTVNIGGTNYIFDPSTKTYSRTAGLSAAAIQTALGYSQSSLINRAENGATITPTSITALNRTNVRDDLTSYANNLVDYIRTNNPAASPADIFGGKTIVPLALGTQLRQTSLSYAVGTVTTAATIPNIYRTTLTLTLGSVDPTTNAFANLPGATPVTFNTSDIYPRRLVVSFNASSIPSILLDGVAQTSASGTVPSGRQLTVRTSISHPYPNGFANVNNSNVIRMTPFANFIYLIGTGWGQVDRGTIEKHRKLLQDNITANPGNPNAESVLGESLAMLGYSWLAECAQQQQLADQLIGSTTIYHHAVGVVGTKAVGSSSGPYVDLPLNQLSIVQRIARPSGTTLTAIEKSAFFSDSVFSSIAESGTLEQTQPGATAASTVKLIDTTLQSGGQVFDINNTAVPGDTPAYYTSTIRPILASKYAPGDLSRIDGQVNSSNLRVVAPADGSIQVDQFTGAGYYQIAQNGSSIGSIITGGLSGGLPASAVPAPQLVNNTQGSVMPAPTQSSFATTPIGSVGNSGGMQVTKEPINLITGDYFNNATDIAIGSREFPYGLSFGRYYDSGTRLRSGVLGAGWTHNFAITASADSDGFAGLSAFSPISGAASIAATFVTLDLLNGSSSLERLLIASVAQRWLMDQLTRNIVSITQPGYVQHFTKLADGSYNPPPGSASVLTLNGSAYQYTTKDQQRLFFTPSGNLQTWTLPSGVSVTLAYSGTPEVLSTISNNLGRTLSLTYAGGLLSQVSDGTGRAVSYAYDASSNLIGATDPLGNQTTYGYDIPGRLTQIFNPANPAAAIVTNTYDSLGRVKTQASGTNPPWQYFLAGTRSEEDDPFGSRHVIYATPRGKTRIEIQDLQGLHLVTSNAFDALDRLVTTTSPEGKSTGYSYDNRSNIVSTTVTPKPGSPLSAQVTSFTYDPIFNKPTSITDPLGLVTVMAYAGGTGNLISTTADFGAAPHLNARQSFAYNGFGQVLTATDPLGIVTRFSYDGFGNQTQVVRDAGAGRLNQQVSLSYNAQGDVVSTTDPRGNTTSSAFDANRRPTSIVAPNGLVTSYSYDANGQVVQTQQSKSGVALRSTGATYSLTGKPVTTTDANGNTTTLTYDALERVSQTSDPLGRVTIIAYDALGRQKSVTNPAIGTTPLLQQTYTPDGMLGSLTDANSHATSFTYDGLDRLATTTYPLGSTESLTYDADNNVQALKTRANQTISFTYDTLNRLKTKTPPSPAPVVTYRYDLTSRLSGVSDSSAAIAAAVPPAGPLVQYATSYSYDVMNRPTGVSWSPAPVQASTATSSITFGHSYNKANQRIRQTVTDNTWLNYPAATGSTTSYSANALNQYTAVGAVTPSYDGNGNLTSDDTFVFGYDAENRLISGTGAGSTATYAFDAQGRRKTRAVNGTTTVFVTDADNREVLEYDGSTGAIQRWYAYGIGPNAVLSQMNVVAATRTTLIPDMLGSIIGLLDSGATSLSKVGYIPYGKSNSAGPFGFTGQRIDLETGGLYYYRARHYSPAFGRFLQADPIGYNGGSNLYAYVGNDPLNATDPTGKDCSTQNGSISCSSSNYQFSVPVATSPLLWPFNGTNAVNFKSTDPGYHAYSTPANNGNAINISPAAANSYIVNNPVPGTSNPATPSGTANDATPRIGNNFAVISPVMSYTTTNALNGSPITVNVTLPGHPLHPGIVVRQVDVTANGGTVINNWGEGTAALQNPNSWMGSASQYINGVWNGFYPRK